MKIVLLILVCLGVSHLLTAQAHYQGVIASDGGSARSDRIALDWTLGEPIVESIYTDDRLYTQGFQQPMLKVVEIQPHINSILSPRSAGMEITAVPNPVSSLLILTMQDLPYKEIDIMLSNSTGQLMFSETLGTESGKASLDLSELSAGMFFLNLYTKEHELLKVFRIVKN